MDTTPSRRTVLAGIAAAVGTTVGTTVLAGPAEAARCDADTVLTNGYVWTVDYRDSIKKAVAIRDGRIVYVGTDKGAATYIGRRTRVVDLRGRMLMPGLHDGHLHVLSGGSGLLGLDFGYAPFTVPQFLDVIARYLAGDTAQEPDGWVQGEHWYVQAMQPVGTTVTRKDLDTLPTRRPIVINSTDGHTSLVNSRALALAGITRDTPNPPTGTIERDASGEPTGILQDGAQRLVSALVPDPTDADNLRYAQAALAALRAQGITTFMDAASSEGTVRTFATLAARGELTARAHFAPVVDLTEADPLPRLRKLRRAYDTGPHRTAANIHVGNVKVFLDGVLQAPAQTAAVLEPYLVDDGHGHMVPGTHSGAVYWPPEKLNALMVDLAAAGLDPHAHAIGDRAVRVALDSFAAVRRAGHRANRLTVAHAELVSPADIPRFGRLDVVAAMGFHWAKPAPDSTDTVEPFLGPERFENYEPEGAVFRAGGRVSLGSDWPVDPLNHWEALRTVITRTAAAGSPYAKYGAMTPRQALHRRIAVRAITLNGAYQLRQERDTGSIEVGKLADLIVLDQNIMTIPVENIGRTKVLLTLVGGRPVHGTYEALAQP
ncbi:amidohydrolase [Yinghuangia soli]|uniref:Amidohydrolase n=1 Tax=Yinghuangia soli TaxID=2908204 RepID=A0AA41Q3Z0_9ACTN|nr:amidohydrolase [Yinghuangia soli]MCF2530891.1 amidohydrolase [Yinghuangia soli]